MRGTDPATFPNYRGDEASGGRKLAQGLYFPNYRGDEGSNGRRKLMMETTVTPPDQSQLLIPLQRKLRGDIGDICAISLCEKELPICSALCAQEVLHCCDFNSNENTFALLYGKWHGKDNRACKVNTKGWDCTCPFETARASRRNKYNGEHLQSGACQIVKTKQKVNTCTGPNSWTTDCSEKIRWTAVTGKLGPTLLPKAKTKTKTRSNPFTGLKFGSSKTTKP
jgi:hypothetical protein